MSYKDRDVEQKGETAFVVVLLSGRSSIYGRCGRVTSLELLGGSVGAMRARQGTERLGEPSVKKRIGRGGAFLPFFTCFQLCMSCAFDSCSRFRFFAFSLSLAHCSYVTLFRRCAPLLVDGHASAPFTFGGKKGLLIKATRRRLFPRFLHLLRAIRLGSQRSRGRIHLNSYYVIRLFCLPFSLTKSSDYVCRSA